MNVEWFASLPDGWSQRRIKTLTPVMRGASPRPIEDPIYFDDDGEYAWVRISDVSTSNGFLTSTTQRLSEIGAARSVKLEPGELFLSIAGSVGKQCITNVRACIHDGFVYFPYLPKESQKFLFWIFESKECFSGLGKLGTQLNLNTQTVGNISIPFPDLPTQRAIADFLDRETARIDTLIERKQRLVELLLRKKDAVRDSAICKGLSNSTKMKSSGVNWFGEIPAHWTICRFNRLIASKVDYRGRTPEKVDEGVFLVTARNIRNGKIDYQRSEEYTTIDDWEKLSARGKPCIGDVIFTTEAPLGQIAQVDRTDVAFAQRIMKFRANELLVTNDFLADFMMTSSFQRSLQLYASGSTAAGIKSERLAHLFGLVPPKAEQGIIISFVRSEIDKLDALEAPINASIDRLKEYRSALITSAVTGQIDVTKWTNAETSDRQLDAIEEEFGA